MWTASASATVRDNNIMGPLGHFLLSFALAGIDDSRARLAVGADGQLAPLSEELKVPQPIAPAPVATLRKDPGVEESPSSVESKETVRPKAMVPSSLIETMKTVMKPNKEDTEEAWAELKGCTTMIFGQIAIMAGLGVILRPKDATPAQPSKPKTKAAAPAGLLMFAMALWVLSAMLLTIFNKWLYLPTGGNFPHAVSLSAWHQFLVVVVTQCIRLSPLGPKCMPAAANHGMMAGLAPHEVVGKVMPPAVCFAGSLAMGNMSMFYLSVSFTQMLRAAKPAGVFLASYAIGMEEWNSWRAMLIFLAVVGVACCSVGEVQFSLVGFWYQMMTFITDITRLITLKMLVSLPRLDPVSAMSVFAPICFLGLLGPAVYLESQNITFLQCWNLRWMLLANGALAVVLNAVSICFMELATPTFFSLTGTLNYLLTAVFSIWLFGTPTSVAQMTSFVITLCAVNAYYYHQHTGLLPGAACLRTSTEKSMTD